MIRFLLWVCFAVLFNKIVALTNYRMEQPAFGENEIMYKRSIFPFFDVSFEYTVKISKCGEI